MNPVGGRPDYLILGGGTAGCVLAARLTEDPEIRVTLVEAGPDLTLESMAPHVRSRYPGRAYLDPGNIWSDLTAYMGAPLCSTYNRKPRRYEQGRLLGGGVGGTTAMVAPTGAGRAIRRRVGGVWRGGGWSFGCRPAPISGELAKA